MSTPVRRASALAALLAAVLMSAAPSAQAASPKPGKSCLVAQVVSVTVYTGAGAETKKVVRKVKPKGRKSPPGLKCRNGVWKPSVRVPWILKRIRGCESGSGPRSFGNYAAQNPVSTASGAYQFLDSTWHKWVRKFRLKAWRAKFAPRYQQDLAAVAEYRQNGTSPWYASRHCWG